VVIAESHLAIHIWPENRYAAIDVFTCGENVRMGVAAAFLKRAFQSKRAAQKSFSRGDRMATASRARASMQRSWDVALA
jgi:S-adenosylmethionine/arginine decarboxylase-like enzyme